MRKQNIKCPCFRGVVIRGAQLSFTHSLSLSLSLLQTYACLSRLKAQLRQLPQEVASQPNSTIFFERSVHSDKSAHSYRLQYTRISTAFLLCIIYAVLVARACYVCYIRTKLTCDEEVCFCICLCV